MDLSVEAFLGVAVLAWLFMFAAYVSWAVTGVLMVRSRERREARRWRKDHPDLDKDAWT